MYWAVTVISGWVGDGTSGNPYMPAFAAHYEPFGVGWDFVSGERPANCTLTAYVTDENTKALLEADSRYATSNWVQLGGDGE